MMKKLLALVLVLLPSLAWGQGAILQNGSVSPGDLGVFLQDRTLESIAKYTANTGKGAKPFSVFDNKGIGVCSNSALTTGSYNAFCLGHDSNGDALLSITGQNGGVAGTPHISLGGTIYPLLGSGSANMIGPSPSHNSDFVLWNGTGGTTTKDTGGDVTWSAGNGFFIGALGIGYPDQATKFNVNNIYTGSFLAPSAVFGHLEYKPVSGSAASPDGIYGDLWYHAPVAISGAGAAVRGNVYTIPNLTASVSAAGSGYTNNDIVTMAGGTCTDVAGGELNTPPQFQITVSGGVVTAAVYVGSGACSVYPASPAAVTGGTGSGLTLAFTNASGLSLTYLNGMYARARHTARGNVSYSIAVFADGAQNTGGGTNDNAIGLFIQPPYDTNYGSAYGIYVNGAYPSGTIYNSTSDIVLNAAAGTKNLISTGPIVANSVVTCPPQMNGGSTSVLTATGAGCGLTLNAQSSGTVLIESNSKVIAEFQAASPSAGVNWLQILGANAAGSGQTIQPAGSDTNQSLAVKPKGSGQVILGSTTLGSVGWAQAATTAAVPGNFSANRYLTVTANGVTYYIAAKDAPW